MVLVRTRSTGAVTTLGVAATGVTRPALSVAMAVTLRGPLPMRATRLVRGALLVVLRGA